MSDVAREVLVARQESEVVKNRVFGVLRDFPSTRGDDLALAMRFYRRFYPWIKSLWDLELASYRGQVPSPDTLSRRRRELVYDEGHAELLPREGTLHKRIVRSRVLREFYGAPRELWSFEVLD